MYHDVDIKKLQSSAEAGSIVAQTLLGMCYLDGIGIAQDYDSAFKWLSAAAERGAPKAMANLGHMVQQGLGTEANPQRAVELLTGAAAKGEFTAQILLARLYVEQGDHRSAHHWYTECLVHPGKLNTPEALAEAKTFISTDDEKNG
jgi:TPR repeat protein